MQFSRHVHRNGIITKILHGRKTFEPYVLPKWQHVNLACKHLNVYEQRSWMKLNSVPLLLRTILCYPKKTGSQIPAIKQGSWYWEQPKSRHHFLMGNGSKLPYMFASSLIPPNGSHLMTPLSKHQNPTSPGVSVTWPWQHKDLPRNETKTKEPGFFQASILERLRCWKLMSFQV